MPACVGVRAGVGVPGSGTVDQERGLVHGRADEETEGIG